MTTPTKPACWACTFAGADPETKELECIKKGVSPYPSWNLSRTGDNLPPGCKNREHFIQHPARTTEGRLFKLHMEDPRLVQIYRDQGRPRPTSCWPCLHSRADPNSKSLGCAYEHADSWWDLGPKGDKQRPEHCGDERRHFTQHPCRSPEGYLLANMEPLPSPELIQIFRDQGRSRPAAQDEGSARPTSCWPCRYSEVSIRSKTLACTYDGGWWSLGPKGDEQRPKLCGDSRILFSQNPWRSPEGYLYEDMLGEEPPSPELVQIFRDQGRSRSEWEADAVRRGWGDGPLPPSRDVLKVEREALEMEIPIKESSQKPAFETVSENAKETLAMAGRVAEKLHARGSNLSLGAPGRDYEEHLRRGVRVDVTKAKGEIRALRMRLETLERAFWGLLGVDPDEGLRDAEEMIRRVRGRANLSESDQDDLPRDAPWWLASYPRKPKGE